MTDQQPHTPYIEDGWLVEPCEPDYAPGISQPIPGSWSKPIVNLAELDGYDELIAAAEQRGAEKAAQIIRQEAKDAVDYEWPHPDDHLHDIANFIEDKYRADQEGDDE